MSLARMGRPVAQREGAMAQLFDPPPTPTAAVKRATSSASRSNAGPATARGVELVGSHSGYVGSSAASGWMPRNNQVRKSSYFYECTHAPITSWAAGASFESWSAYKRLVY